MFSNDLLTICHCVLIEPNNGSAMGFTDHDCDLVINGITYKANTATDPTAVAQKTNLSTDNLEIKSLLDDSAISGTDISAGKYDNAKITIVAVDFLNLPATLEGGQILLVGQVGETTATETTYQFEVVSRSSILNRQLNKKTSPLCPYKFGDSRCKKDLSGLTYNVSVSSVSSANQFALSGNLSDGRLEAGTVTFTSGTNQGNVADVKSFSNDLVTLYEPLPFLPEVGDSVTAVAGCKKTFDGANSCSYYNNIENFGGIPPHSNFMPGEDQYLAGENAN